MNLEREKKYNLYIFSKNFFLKYNLTTIIIAFIIITNSVEAKKAAIIIDYETNNTLFEVNADTLNYPASLAKMMTLYMVFEAIENKKLTWDQKLKVSTTAASRSPSKLYLEPGTYISVKDAVMALVVKSANDVATTISESLATSEREFAKKMTAKAREIGMHNTTYKNASGLPNRAQLTTARDTAILSIALIRNYPEYYKLFKKEKFVWRGKNYKNHNKLLKSYNGADGIKTGYIYASGFQLALSAVRNDKRLIGIYFGGDTAKHRDNTLRFLMDKGFNKLEDDKLKIVKKTDVESTNEKLTMNIYKIVVGTFKYKKNANRQVKIIKSIFPEILKNRESLITSRQGKTRVWYETQFLSFNKKEANKICTLMKKNKIDCFVTQKI